MGIFNKTKKDSNVKPVEKKPAKKQTKKAEKKEDLTLGELENKQAKIGKVVKKDETGKAVKGSTGLSYKWILRPVITEKATYLGAQDKYVFEVALTANKIEVSKAIEKLYNVKVIKVNIIRQRGKRVSYGRINGRTKRTKKAIITLQKGQSISVYEGV